MAESNSSSATISANAKKRTAPRVSLERRTSRTRRHARLRKKVNGTLARPRLVVNRSSRHLVVQLIDDVAAPRGPGYRRPPRPPGGRRLPGGGRRPDVRGRQEGQGDEGRRAHRRPGP